MRNTQLVVDLKAVAYISFYYKNQYGDVSKTKPKFPTIDKIRIPSEYAFPLKVEFPHETMIEKAIRLNVIDRWHEVCVYAMRNNHNLVFKGEEAIKRRDQYNCHIFKKSK